MYGQTEATARMAYLPPHLAASRPTTIGLPIPGGSFSIEPVPDAAPDVGELVYAGPNVMLGYAEVPADLAAGRVIEELRTGDLAREAPDGLYEIVGRRSRFVKPYGLRVDLDELERALQALGIDGRCAGSDRIIVTAVSDPRRSAEVTSALRARTGLPASAVAVVVLPELPLTPSGKTDYQAILALGPPPADLQVFPGLDPVRQLFGRVLDVRPAEIRGTDTFVALGGDSLTYVELAVHLERAIGPLPADWHQRRVDELRPLMNDATRRATLDTTVLLRALAILAIVVSHASSAPLRGAAHLLLVVSGFNFARFQLADQRDGAGAGRLWRSAVRIAVPSAVCIAALQLVTGELRSRQLLLVNSLLGSPPGRGHWKFWYVEVLVQLLLVLALLLRSRRLRTLERRQRLGFAWMALAVALGTRFVAELLPTGPHPRFQLQHVVWLFALGWLLERSRTSGQRLVALACGGLALVGYFDRPAIGLAVFGGVLLLATFPAVPAPSRWIRPIAVVAAASLHIYLSHWIVLHLLGGHRPAFVVAVAVAVGVALHRGLRRPARA